MTDHENDLAHLNACTKDSNDKIATIFAAQNATNNEVNVLKELIKDLAQKI